MTAKRPVALIILDGWGIREMTHGNAVAQAHTPNFDRWLHSGERAILDASGEAVGLPANQMGNSEVGHLNLGAGRIVYQDISRIDRAIADGSFAQNEVLIHCLKQVQNSASRLHVVGLLGTGGVHSHSRHLYALLAAAKAHNVSPILHVVTDGRDTPPDSAQGFLRELEERLQNDLPGRIASVSGRYYAMDRDKRWPRVQKAYDVMVHRQGNHAASAMAAIEQAHAAGETDEFITPTVVGDAGDDELKIQSGDYVLCFNFRADRMRQLVRMLANLDMGDFKLENPATDLHILTMTEYESELPVAVIFGQNIVKNPLAQVLSDAGLRQFHAAETEKYAHVTYFFNGGEEKQFAGEERLLVPSPKVATYDLQPEMSAHELADKLVQRIEQVDDDFILINFANPDMVGHTGSLAAAIKAVEAADECAAKVVAALNKKGGVALVTADHGNAERMIDEWTHSPHTYHTTSPVSLLLVGEGYTGLRPRGILADVAPTVLALLGIEQPAEMTGVSLLVDTL
ncbi:MAG: 2,3-bisphosphoglycerate-independent phosphoglycerate mutase [Caldilineaceae bacterium]